jgi:hypothetical protein
MHARFGERCARRNVGEANDKWTKRPQKNRPLCEKNRGRIVCPHGDALSQGRFDQGTVPKQNPKQSFQI